MGRTRQTKVSDLFSLGKRNRETVEKKGKKKGDVESPKRKKKKLNDEDDEAFSPVESSEEEAYSPEKLDIDEEPLVDVVMSSPERSPSPVSNITKMTNIEYNNIIYSHQRRKEEHQQERKKQYYHQNLQLN